MKKNFKDFSEIEQEVTQKAPPVIYKYRDWKEEYHKQILTDNIIWFAHPKSLNDPNDIRAPYRFDFNEVNHPLFYNKLKKYAALAYPNVLQNSIQFELLCQKHLRMIKKDPKSWFESRFSEIRESNIYDCMGLFSTSQDPGNETMWAHYSKNGTGVCIGFDTIPMLKELRVAFGPAIYQDEPLLYSFILEQPVTDSDEYAYKHSKWSYEKEFRLLDFRFKDERLRRVVFSKGLIKCVILGINSSDETKQEIIDILKSKYNSSIQLLKAQTSVSSFGLSLVEVLY